jgi:dihydrofolate reductase
VLSSKLQDPEWERTAVLRSVDDIRALKSETGRDIVTTGSIRLVRELIAAGLVDEYRLFTYPVVPGRGQRLFADATEVPGLPLHHQPPARVCERLEDTVERGRLVKHPLNYILSP